VVTRNMASGQYRRILPLVAWAAKSIAANGDDRVRGSRTALRIKINNANRHAVGGEAMSDCGTDDAGAEA
jgi:hypothetical protein